MSGDDDDDDDDERTATRRVMEPGEKAATVATMASRMTRDRMLMVRGCFPLRPEAVVHVANIYWWREV